MSNLYREPSKTKFRFIWPSGFRGEDFKKSANQKQELPMVAMFVNGSWQNEPSLERTFHRCFLPSFTSFGWGVSEEKIKMWKVNGRQTPSDGKSSHCLWQDELKRQVFISKILRTASNIQFDNYSQTCIKRSPLGQRKSGLIRQVTS